MEGEFGVEHQNETEPDRWPEFERQIAPSQPMFNVPGVILVLIALFALVHGVRSYILTPEQDLAFLIKMAFIPARYFEGVLGSGLEGLTSPISYSFLHGDLTHLGVNCVWLLAMGSAVAKRIGAVRFLLFSIVCGIFAALAHLLSHTGEMIPVIGASGAISGHMAAAIRFIFSASNDERGAGMLRGDLRDIPLQPLTHALQDGRVLAVLGIWLATNVVTGMGFVPISGEGNSIAWEAHIGGLVAGLLLFSLFDLPGNGRELPQSETEPHDGSSLADDQNSDSS